MDAIPSHSEHARIVAKTIADKLRTPSWTRCPSTHCERSRECRSPNECSGSGAGMIRREVYAAIMRERGEGEEVVQMLVTRDAEAEAVAGKLRAAFDAGYAAGETASAAYEWGTRAGISKDQAFADFMVTK